MEAILGLVAGICIGSLVAWLVMRLRSGGNASRLEAEAKLAKQRIEEFEQANSKLQQESTDWRNQAIDNRTEVASLQAQLLSANQNTEESKRSNEELGAEIHDWQSKANENGNKVAELQAQLDAANKRLVEQTDIEKTLLDQFKVMASEVVSNNNETFLTTADEKIGTLVKQAKNDFDFSRVAVRDLVKPLSDELKRIEEARNTSQGSLKQQIETLTSSNKALEEETRNLSTALKRPEARGSWGEIQLRRVVELAGMSNHCDFSEQVSVTSRDGKTERPDMIIYMPSNRTIVVDAKTSMKAYQESINSQTDTEREKLLNQHASQVNDRAKELSSKAYWDSLTRSPEFVVMFLPGEFLLQPALERDPELFDRAMQQKVIITTPNTLVALLKTVEMGWREARLAEEAAKIGNLGQQLHDRLYTFANHMDSMRKSLSSTVDHFNRGVGSLERNVFTSARRFKELGITSNREIAEIEPVNSHVRQLKSVTDTPALTDAADN